MAHFDPSCIDVVDYLDCLEIRNVEKATEREYRFSCPYPAHLKGDESPSAYMNAESTKFFCHSCKAKGDAVTLAAYLLRVSPVIAIRMLKQRYSPGGIDPDSRCMVEEIRRIIHAQPIEPRKNKIYDESKLYAYEVDWPTKFIEWREGAAADWVEYLFEKRGFEPEWLMNWEFGWAEWCHRVTLPIRDENGFLIGIKARACDGRKEKYKNLYDKLNGIEPYLKNEIVFALDRALALPWLIEKYGLIIVEGEYNAIAMHELGYRNTVAINGSYFGDRQIRLIKQHTDRAVLFFDSDPAGFQAVHDVARALEPSMFVKVCPDHDGDPMDMHSYSIRRCLMEALGYREVVLMRS